MADIASLAQPAVASIEGMQDDQLYVELGERVALLKVAPGTAGEFMKPKVTELPPEVKEKIEIETLGMVDTVRYFSDLGKTYFSRVNRQAFELVCGSNPDDMKARQDLTNALFNKQAATAVLAGLLVTSLGLSPLVAPVVAVLAMKLCFDPAHQTLCTNWKANLPND